MQPRKDYDDYTRFINDTYSGEKEKMISNTVNFEAKRGTFTKNYNCLLYTSPSPRDYAASRMPSSA